MFFKYLMSVSIIFFLAACSQESHTKEHTYTGTFVDAPVSGLAYSCASTSNIYETDAEGKFTCQVWEKASFQLNGLPLGEASGSDKEKVVVTPYSLSPDDSLCAVNVARLLQTLDTKSQEEVLHLDKNLLKKVPADINCSSPTFTEEAQKALEVPLVTPEEAKKKMDKSVVEHGADVPSTPTLAAFSTSLEENATGGMRIGEIRIIDTGSSDLTSMQLSGAGSQNFLLTIDGKLSVAIDAHLDYETTPQYNLTAVAINQAGSSNRATVQINIIDINESTPSNKRVPVLESATFTVAENTPAHTLIGQIPILQSGSTPITNISLIGDQNTSFLVSLDGNLTVSENAQLDYEQQQLYLLQAVATNSVGKSDAVDINISISDVNETILPQLANTNVSIEENATEGAFIGYLNILNTGVPPLTSITLSGSGSSNFLVSTNGAITTSPGAILDYETTPLYQLTAIATNSAGSSQAANLTITILDVNETTLIPPTLIDSTASIAENSSAGSLVGTINISNEGSSPITAITLNGNGSYNFEVSNTGTITVSIDGYLDYETTPLYNLTAVATNSAGESNIVDVNITILDVQEEPVLDATSLSVSENASAGTVVGYVPINQSGASTITSMSLSGTGSSNFTISPSGDVTVASNASLDYETTSSYSLSAIATNSYGSSAPVSVTISITDYANPFLIAKLKSNIILENDKFGFSVAVNGDYVVVGTDNTTDETSAQLFKRGTNNSVTRLIKLSPSGTIWNNGSTTGKYQINVAINGNYILLGYPRLSFSGATDRGAAYLFKRISDTNVTQIAEIIPSNGVAGDNFGISVDLDGDYLLIGAVGRDVTGSTDNDGGAYLFKRVSDTNVSQLAMLTASDASSYDSFGNAVSIHGDYLLIGAVNDDVPSADEGSAYLFKRNSDSNISQIAKVVADDAQNSDRFGHSVSIDYPYFVIGTNNASGTDPNGESIYLFEIYSDSNVSQVQRIQGSSSTTGDHFGSSVAINKNYIVAGSYYNTIGSEYTYIYRKATDNSITEVKKLVSNKPKSGDSFGYSVAIDTNLIAIGAVGEGTSSYEGAAYIFDMEPFSRPYFYNPPTDVNRSEVFKKGVIHSFSNEAASPAGSLTYSSGGTDGSHFSFSGADIYFLSNVTTDAAADYEVPVDSDTDNNYSVTVTAMDPSGTTTTHNLNITILDKAAFEVAAFSGYDSQNGDAFASSIATDGNYTIVGAPGEDSTAVNSGAAYLYYKNPADQSVVKVAKIKAPAGDIDSNDTFGNAVAIDGDYIVIGAENDDSNGSAYVYKRVNNTTVQFLSKIQGSNASGNDKFGNSVSIYNKLIAVGSPLTDNGATNDGYTYIYDINSSDGVNELISIPSPDQVNDNNFGQAVSINLDYLLVGSRLNANNQGHGYLFYIDTASTPSATKTADINASDAGNDNNFSQSLSLSGDYMIIGAPGNDTNGSAYIFKKDAAGAVTEIVKLHPNDLSTAAYYGASVSMYGESGNYKTVIAGAPHNATPQLNSGSVYLYSFNILDHTTVQLDKLTPSDASIDKNFGEAVSANGDTLSIGMKFVDTQSSGTTAKGKAYIFIKDPNQPIP